MCVVLVDHLFVERQTNRIVKGITSHNCLQTECSRQQQHGRHKQLVSAQCCNSSTSCRTGCDKPTRGSQPLRKLSTGSVGCPRQLRLQGKARLRLRHNHGSAGVPSCAPLCVVVVHCSVPWCSLCTSFHSFQMGSATTRSLFGLLQSLEETSYFWFCPPHINK